MPDVKLKIRRKPTPARAARAHAPVPPAAPPPSPAESSRASVQVAADAFKQVSHPSRLYMMMLLAEAPRDVGTLADLLETNQPAISHHLSMLRLTRMVQTERDGKHTRYSLSEVGRRLVATVAVLMA